MEQNFNQISSVGGINQGSPWISLSEKCSLLPITATFRSFVFLSSSLVWNELVKEASSKDQD